MFNVPVTTKDVNEVIISLFEDVNRERVINNCLQKEIQTLQAGYRVDMFAAALYGVGIGMIAAVIISIVLEDNMKK